MKCLLRRALDEAEFLSPHGIRGLSKIHEQQPYELPDYAALQGMHTTVVRYEPAESTTALFGGNSNWRGPVWFPMNYLLVESLQKFHHYYGDDFQVECPVGSGELRTLNEVAQEISDRLASIFLLDADGNRPVYGHHPGNQRRSPFPRLHLVLRVFPRRYGARSRRVTPNRLDRIGRQAASTTPRVTCCGNAICFVSRRR